MDIESQKAELTELLEPKKIYSKKAIWGFSVFFTPIFGGVLLMQNLFDIGKRKEGYRVLIMAIILSAAIYGILFTVPKQSTGLTFLLNGAGGYVLSEVFFPKYFPSKDQYLTKAIWKPLIISLIIILPFLLAAIFFG
jgi:hypothetical protein